MTNPLPRYWPLYVLVFLQCTFLIWPEIDLWLGGLFYTPRDGFFFADGLAIRILDVVFGNLHIVGLLLLPWLLLASAYWVGPAEALLRRRLLFLFLVIVLAPGLAVGILNAESGRAPPHSIEVYAGDKHFSGAFRPAAECRSRCSFVSRHAVVGFTLIAFAWILAERRWFAVGITVGAIAGLGQIVQGNHYPSDVLFGFWIVYGVCLVLARLLFGDQRVSAPDG